MMAYLWSAREWCVFFGYDTLDTLVHSSLHSAAPHAPPNSHTGDSQWYSRGTDAQSSCMSPLNPHDNLPNQALSFLDTAIGRLSRFARQYRVQFARSWQYRARSKKIKHAMPNKPPLNTSPPNSTAPLPLFLVFLMAVCFVCQSSFSTKKMVSDSC